MSYQYFFLQTITRESLLEEMTEIKKEYSSETDSLRRVCLLADFEILVSIALEKFDIRKNLNKNHLKSGRLKIEETVQLMSDYIELLKPPQQSN